MHTIPPTVLEEMLQVHARGWGRPDWNFGLYKLDAGRVSRNIAAMFEQDGFEIAEVQAAGYNHPVGTLDEAVRVGTLDEAVGVQSGHAMEGCIVFQVSRDGEVIFEGSSMIVLDGADSQVELVFFEHRLDLLNRPELWHAMVEYARHAARVVGTPGILVFDGSVGEDDQALVTAGREPSCPDRAIWVDR